MREFDVRTYIVDLVEYMHVLCSIHSLEFLNKLANFYMKYMTL